jgi:hypothetical protein
VTLSILITLGILLLFVLLAIWLVLFIYLRAKNQRVVLSNGVLSIADPLTGALKGFPVADIGTAVYLPERTPPMREASNGIWTWGGIILLDRAGHLVRHITAVAGTDFPLRSIWEQIPAPVHRELDSSQQRPYFRSDFKKAFPHALRFGQLWGALNWMWFILFLVFIALPVVAFIAVFIAVLVLAATGASF